jgi:hypothetical protein
MGHVALMGDGRSVYSVLVGRPTGKRPLEKPCQSWKDNIKLDLRAVGIDGLIGFSWLSPESNGGILQTR